jgi:chaperone modulatory protein CbpM
MTQSSVLYVSFAELHQSACIPAEHLQALIDFQIIAPVSGEQIQEWLFRASSLSIVKKALRLHHDLELDWQAIALVLDLIEEREQLKNENAALRHCLQRYVGDAIE